MSKVNTQVEMPVKIICDATKRIGGSIILGLAIWLAITESLGYSEGAVAEALAVVATAVTGIGTAIIVLMWQYEPTWEDQEWVRKILRGIGMYGLTFSIGSFAAQYFATDEERAAFCASAAVLAWSTLVLFVGLTVRFGPPVGNANRIGQAR